jgi:hypothetical protein
MFADQIADSHPGRGIIIIALNPFLDRLTQA